MPRICLPDNYEHQLLGPMPLVAPSLFIFLSRSLQPSPLSMRTSRRLYLVSVVTATPKGCLKDNRVSQALALDIAGGNGPHLRRDIH